MAQVTYEIDILGERRVIEKLSDISKLSSEINQKLNSTKFSDANYQSLIKSQQALQGVANQVNVYNQTLGAMTRSGSQAGIALQNLNFVIRDSPYFLKDMQLGVLAVGNNINPLIDSFIKLRLESQRLSAETGKTVTTMSLLKNALVGGVGLSVALSLVVTAFQAFIFAQQTGKSKVDEGTEALKKQKEEVFGLRNQYYAYAKERALMMKEDLSDKRLKALNEEYAQALKTKDAYQAEYDLFKRIDDKTGKISEQQKEAKKNLDAENALLESIASQTEAILFIRNGLYKTEEKRTKQLKEQKYDLREVKDLLEEMYEVLLRPEWDFNRRSALANPFSEYNLKNQFGMGGLQNIKNPMDDMIKQIEGELKPIFQSITEVANVAGNAISNAFLSGKNAIDAATQALMQFIVQLLVVQSLKGLLGMAFGLPFGAGFLSGIVPSVGGASGGSAPKIMPKSAASINAPAIRVVGKITADKNNFIANIKNADSYYDRNERFVLIGR